MQSSVGTKHGVLSAPGGSSGPPGAGTTADLVKGHLLISDILIYKIQSSLGSL